MGSHIMQCNGRAGAYVPIPLCILQSLSIPIRLKIRSYMLAPSPAPCCSSLSVHVAHLSPYMDASWSIFLHGHSSNFTGFNYSQAVVITQVVIFAGDTQVVNLCARGCAATYHNQGSPNRWKPVRFDRLPVKPVRIGSGSGRYPIGQNSKFKFEFKKMKNS